MIGRSPIPFNDSIFDPHHPDIFDEISGIVDEASEGSDTPTSAEEVKDSLVDLAGPSKRHHK